MQPLVLAWLAKIFPLLAAKVAMDPSKVDRVGLTAVAGGGRRVQSAVMHNHCVHAASFSCSQSTAVLPILSALVAINVRPIRFVWRIGRAHVEIAIEDG